jgi:microcystin degradation protein MlrC
MKLFMAALLTETNTFSPLPTGRAGFFGERYHRTDGSRHPPAWGNIALIEWRRMAEAEGIAVQESVCAQAQPGGITVRAVYEELRDTILADLRAAGPQDIVLLNLHGAMVADGYEDCEGDLTARVRAIVGPDAVIGVELDLHCSITTELCDAATLIVTYKEYPHTDIADRARDLFGLALRAARREIRPVLVARPLRMVNMWHTPVQPMRGLVDEMLAEEASGAILSLSFAHGFPWGDVPEVAAKMIAIADGDRAKAEAAAERYAKRLWDLREQTAKRFDTVDEAISAALAAPSGKPTVIAESSDNAGGGAPSDCTAVLERLVARGVRDAAIGMVWDPIAVGFCFDAGEGARLRLRIGGKCGEMSGDPIDLDVTIRGLKESHRQRGLSGGTSEVGRAAWLEADGLHIILGSIRQQVFHPDMFEGLGCTLADKRIVVVKSSQHFYAGFAPIAQAVRYCAAPIGILRDFRNIPLTRIATPWWPKVEDPWS